MTRTNAKRGQVRVPIMPITDIRPSPENDDLYGPIDPADPDIRALAKSIRKYGVREPKSRDRLGSILRPWGDPRSIWQPSKWPFRTRSTVHAVTSRWMRAAYSPSRPTIRRPIPRKSTGIMSLRMVAQLPAQRRLPLGPERDRSFRLGAQRPRNAARDCRGFVFHSEKEGHRDACETTPRRTRQSC